MFGDLYSLGEVLGTGAYSIVRTGSHKRSAKEFAVKCVDRKKLSDTDAVALRDEVKILHHLAECPHIIRLHDFFEEPKMFYLIMESMDGGELFDRIVQKSFYNEKEARGVCKTLLEAVAYCHDRRIAHRDLKPENLLLRSKTDDSNVKIADFGFAKVVRSPCSLHTQCGTPGYVAPEILNGTAHDERVDLWSLGVILYILLGGYPPFNDSEQRLLFRKIRKGQYEFHEEYWGGVSEDAKDLIRALLVVKPGKRLTAYEALESNWIAVAEDEALEKNDMAVGLNQLRKFNGKRKFRAAVASVIAVNKLKNFLSFDTFQPGCNTRW